MRPQCRGVHHGPIAGSSRLADKPQRALGSCPDYPRAPEGFKEAQKRQLCDRTPEVASLGRFVMREIVRARINVVQCIISLIRLDVLLPKCDIRPCGTASVLPGATLQGMNHEQHQPSRRVPNKRALIMPSSWTPSKL